MYTKHSLYIVAIDGGSESIELEIYWGENAETEALDRAKEYHGEENCVVWKATTDELTVEAVGMWDAILSEMRDGLENPQYEPWKLTKLV